MAPPTLARFCQIGAVKHRRHRIPYTVALEHNVCLHADPQGATGWLSLSLQAVPVFQHQRLATLSYQGAPPDCGNRQLIPPLFVAAGTISRGLFKSRYVTVRHSNEQLLP